MNGGNEDFDLLRELVGDEMASKVVEALGGSTIYIPSYKKDIATASHDSIKEEFCNGASYRELAVKYGYTKSYIREIVHKRK
jgi:Mor family transcriptional regulator